MTEPKIETIDDFQIYGQVVLANKIFTEYLQARSTLGAIRRLEIHNKRKEFGFPDPFIEPERYAECWIKERVVGGTQEWKEGISDTFIKIYSEYYTAESSVNE